MRWAGAAAAGLVVVAIGCGRGSPPVAPVAQVEAVPRCDALPQIELPEEHLRDEPIYVANEQPVEELSAWAGSRPGFEQLWLDRDHLGWVVLAFSTDAETRQTELNERFPDVGAVVVGVDWTMEELTTLQQRVTDELDIAVGSSISVTHGVVTIEVGPLTDERLAAVAERFGGERICVSGVDPADLPSDGPQVAGGDGWRLLADEAIGETYRTWIAADEDAYAQLWREIGLSSEPPAVDLATEVVIWFGAVYSGSCPNIRLDRVEVDHERALVYPEITRIDEASGLGCTDDANPRAYVVAVAREMLPTGPFAIQLGPADPPSGAPEERTLVDADLTRPGAAPAPGQVHSDPDLGGPEEYVVGPGGIIEPGHPAGYRFWLHCGPEWLGPLNDMMWRSDVTDIPPAWRAALDGSGEELIVEVLMATDPPTLTATANGHEIVYVPSSAAPPGCD